MNMTVGIKSRPSQSMVITTREGKRYDLGKQVEGDDWVARFYQWRQQRKIRRYCRARLRTLTGVEREDFLEMMEANRG